MKIIAVISSPRRNGNTAALTCQAAAGARSVGADVEEINLPDYQIGFCKGCLSCLSQGACPIQDDFAMIREKLCDADGIIISSPSYGIAPTAVMKCFLDRFGMLNAYTSSLAGKYVASISAAGAIGAKQVAKGLAALVGNGAFARGYVSGLLAVNTGWNKTCTDDAVLHKAFRLGIRLAHDIKKGATYPLQNLGGRLINRLFVRKVFSGNVLAHKDGGMRAVYENLVSRGYLKKEA